MDLKKITTEDLMKELERRKKSEIPKLVKELNTNLLALNALGIEVEHYDEEFTLEKITYEEINGEFRVFYIDKGM